MEKHHATSAESKSVKPLGASAADEQEAHQLEMLATRVESGQAGAMEALQAELNYIMKSDSFDTDMINRIFQADEKTNANLPPLCLEEHSGSNGTSSLIISTGNNSWTTVAPGEKPMEIKKSADGKWQSVESSIAR